MVNHTRDVLSKEWHRNHILLLLNYKFITVSVRFGTKQICWSTILKWCNIQNKNYLSLRTTKITSDNLHRILSSNYSNTWCAHWSYPLANGKKRVIRYHTWIKAVLQKKSETEAHFESSFDSPDHLSVKPFTERGDSLFGHVFGLVNMMRKAEKSSSQLSVLLFIWLYILPRDRHLRKKKKEKKSKKEKGKGTCRW